MGKQTIVGDGKQIYHFEFTTLEGVVNAEDGVIEGVSVITGGVQAKGHNLEVDATTLEQMRDLGIEKGQVPVKWNHKSGADAVNGFLQNFRIKGKKLLADWHLLKTHPQYDQALELGELLDVNEQLLGENAILAEAYQELSAKTRNVIEFSAGTDGTPRPTVRSTGGRTLTAFEQRVEQLKREGKGPADAMIFAVEENDERYQQHLKAKGAFAKTL